MQLRRQFAVLVGTADTPFLSSNERRTGIIVSCPAANRLTLSFAGAAADKQGITLYAASLPLILTDEHIGQAIREEIRAIMLTAGEVIGGLELSEMDCDCPAGREIERRLR